MISLREAIIEDYRELHKINSLALGYKFDEEKTRKNLEYILSKSYYKLIVACDEEKPIGYIQGADYDNTYFEPLKNIMGLAVLDEYRGKGIGKMLILALEDWARKTGAVGVRLVSGYNRTEAHGFYAHMGYELRKEQKNFIKFFKI